MEATGFPVLLQHTSVVVILEREDNEPPQTQCTLQILLDENLILNEAVNINFGAARRHRQAINVQGLVVQSPGTVFVKIRHNNADLGVYRFPVASSAAAKR